MRLLSESFPGRLLSLGLLAALAGCGGLGSARPETGAALTPGVNGPSADYPVVIGDPYVVDGVTYKPEDVWNYDEVGLAAADAKGASGVTGSHHTLPLPSYVEVTSLETGRTILVRLERRGPMDGKALVSLSQGALTQLGAKADTPVRVRRVNPPEQERAVLRGGGAAAARMDTPMSLVNVLRRKLPDGGGAPQPEAAPAKPAVVAEVEEKPTPSLPPLNMPRMPVPQDTTTPVPAPSPTPVAKPEAKQADAPKPPAAKQGRYVVQAGAFSSKDKAERIAKAIGGHVSQTGSLYRVRTGPFASKKEAEASLAKVKAAGYSEARIFING